MNLSYDARTSESKMADISRQKTRDIEKLQAITKENDLTINTMMSNRKNLISTIPQIDANAGGLNALLQSLSATSKKLAPEQRNRLLRSINNAMNAIGSLKKDLNSVAFDCSMQATSLKYKNDGLKRDLNRRKI